MEERAVRATQMPRAHRVNMMFSFNKVGHTLTATSGHISSEKKSASLAPILAEAPKPPPLKGHENPGVQQDFWNKS